MNTAMIQNKIELLIKEALEKLSMEVGDVLLEHPNKIEHGDFSTNVAMVLAKETGKNSKELAKEILKNIERDKNVEKVEVAGPGFINFYLSKEFFAKSLKEINKTGDNWGKNTTQKGKKVMVEYTDPNPFKVFHIGHLMSNTIGESISRLIEYSGAEVKRANYQGDVGPHVAKAIWGLQHGHGGIDSSESLGKAYVAGAKEYEENMEEIDIINKSIYEKSDKEINGLYEKGKKVSLEYFEEIYKTLGTSFDYSFFESETWREGMELVKKNTPKVFEKSEGAIVFKGEKFDKKLHTRVFINSEGLPMYETKDLGLAYKKKEKYNFDLSITITASEQTTYFTVMLKALEQFNKELANKIIHISHGMMKLPSGKMSSRTGDVISAENLIEEVKHSVLKITKDRDIEDKEKIVEQIAIGALKYSILKQDPEKDIIYDLEKSLSFDGDSGPYLQYARTRAESILAKAKGKAKRKIPEKTTIVEKLLYKFPEVVRKAGEEYEPHHVAVYLTELSGAFNSFYGSEKIIGGEHQEYYIVLTKAFKVTMENGLFLLGIKAPKKM